MFTVNRLQARDRSSYETLTFQYARPLLHQLDGSHSCFAIGAEWKAGMKTTEAVGLIVIHGPEGTACADVVSLFVKAGFRRRGIASALLRQAEILLRESGFSHLSFAYYSGKKITPALESFLNSEGWSQPVLDGKVYKTDMRIAEAPWVRKTGMPKGMRSFYWQELCEEEKTRLRELEGELYPAFLSPFKARLPLEKSNSLGLRVQGETVGWCITYRVAEDTVLYDSVFVTPEFRLSGCAFMLIAQSISIQLERNIPHALFAVNNQSPFMRKMLDRWLGPYTTGISERKAAYKELSGAGGLSLGSSG